MASKWKLIRSRKGLDGLYKFILARVGKQDWRGGRNLNDKADMDAIQKEERIRCSAAEYFNLCDSGASEATCEGCLTGLVGEIQFYGKWRSKKAIRGAKSIAGGLVAYSPSENDRNEKVPAAFGSLVDGLYVSRDKMRRVVFESKKPGVHMGIYAGSGFLQMLIGALAHKAGIGLLINGRKFGVYWFEASGSQSLICNKAGECDEWVSFDHIDDLIVFAAHIAFFLSEPDTPDEVFPRKKPRNGPHEFEHQPSEENEDDTKQHAHDIEMAPTDQEERKDAEGRNGRQTERSPNETGDEVVGLESLSGGQGCSSGSVAVPLRELKLSPRLEPQSESSDVWEHFAIECKDGLSLRCVRLRDDLDEETRQSVMGELEE
jgi:hypothetical protein